MYQTYSSPSGQQYIVLVASNLFIPVDSLNTDYQNYQAWVAAGNTAGVYSP